MVKKQGLKESEFVDAVLGADASHSTEAGGAFDAQDRTSGDPAPSDASECGAMIYVLCLTFGILLSGTYLGYLTSCSRESITKRADTADQSVGKQR